MAISQLLPEEQNISQAPTLGMMGGTLGSGGQQRRNVSQKGSGFTNLQQYVTANEGNRNPQIVAQRQKQAETGLSEAQKGFESQAQQAQTGLKGVQGVQQFVGNVLQDPTKSASTPETLKRFTALRTGQENIGSPTDIMNQYNLAKTGLQSQQQDIGTGLQRDVTTNLQDYIRSQRVNPQLATQGENILDRFLTESTAGGQQALESARQKASEIQQTAIPTIAGKVEALQSQLGTPSYLSLADIQSAINRPAQAEQQALSNINKQYLQERMGLGKVANKSIEGQLASYDEAVGYRKKLIDELKSIDPNNPNTKSLYSQFLTNIYGVNPYEVATGGYYLQQQAAQAQALEQARQQALAAVAAIQNQTENQRKERENRINTLVSSIKDQNDIINLYNENQRLDKYREQLNKSKQDILSQYDPNRLARLNALTNLSGTDLYSNLLSQGIS
jgi:hypothetical protein